MQATGNPVADLFQQFAHLKARQAQVKQLIATHAALLNKIGPTYDTALKQLELALETKLEIDTLIGYIEQLISDAQLKKLTGDK